MTYQSINEQSDGWMDGWMDGWVGGWMDELVDSSLHHLMPLFQVQWLYIVLNEMGK
jgi:hypothetical protein